MWPAKGFWKTILWPTSQKVWAPLPYSLLLDSFSSHGSLFLAVFRNLKMFHFEIATRTQQTGLPRNEGPGLHVWLVGMLLTSFLLQKTHCIFFPCWFLWLCRTPSVPLCTWSMVHFAVSNEFGDWETFFNTKNTWCGSISSRFPMMLSSILVFASRCSGAESWCRGDPNNCHRLGAVIEMDGNTSCKSLIVWDRSWLVVWLTISNSHLELFISRPTEDSPFLMKAALLSTVCGSPPMQSSPRYQTFRSDLTSDVTPWMARAKRAGPGGPPCCTPVAEWKQKSPWKRDDFEE